MVSLSGSEPSIVSDEIVLVVVDSILVSSIVSVTSEVVVIETVAVEKFPVSDISIVSVGFRVVVDSTVVSLDVSLWSEGGEDVLFRLILVWV